MTIAEVLLLDFDTEAVNTKRVLERVPDDKFDWKPHDKSMSLRQIARHVTTLPYFGLDILTTDVLDMKTNRRTLPDTAKAAEMLALAAGAAAEVRTKLATMTDDELRADWTLRYGEHQIAKAPRMLCYRTMFFNHLIHHRGQLNVYLRLLDIKVPGIYGPSADEPFGA